MNIVIAGDGEVGLHLAKLLTSENHNITIIATSDDLLKMVDSNADFMAIKGDSTSLDVLKNARVRKSDLFISAVHEENINIISCILAKKLGAELSMLGINVVIDSYLAECGVKDAGELTNKQVMEYKSRLA